MIIHRWRARYASYTDYIDHDEFAVTYVTTEVGESGVPRTAAEVALVGATDDLPSVRDRIQVLAARYGAPALIIALKEDDLLVAAQLREEWGCPGPTRPNLIRFRDKLIMLTAVQAAGLAVPAFAPAPSMEAVVEFAAAHGWPVVVKPRTGSSSAGVTLVTSEPIELDFESYGPLLVQAYDPRQIYHVDGFTDGTGLGPFRASRYVNSCLGFRRGDVLGSVEEDDPALMASIGAFTEQTLAALADGPTVFHLEIFCDRDTGSCTFLEVGARVGGAEIPFLWNEVHGYDLMEAAFRMALGERPRPFRTPFREVAGWLLVPAPAARPCRIAQVTPMLGTVPGPYAEALLQPGEVIPAADAYYEHVGGRFRFRGSSSAAVEEAIIATARGYHVRAEPVL
ncbi:biotin carboxylase [Micromonospora sp. RTP1Z1]|uniref:ATP-grasp domain-containing protein n=1 Tax=Micromonospora sp. RTP1Z1 TaxID=2994043 RepID=UPI0029C84FA2|nr:biotin carboxylase [Micromonospora sp. RTP1Z1]